MKHKSLLLKHFSVIAILFALTISFQNCGRVNVNPIQFSSQSTVGMELSMKPPTNYQWNRRYIFFVDMSYSMVSGPCAFDVDVENSVHGFTGAYVDFDPNFPESGANFNDARYRVADCSVDPSAEFGSMILDYKSASDRTALQNHKTYKGADFHGNRFAVLEKWIEQMRTSNNDEFLQRTQVIVIPTASGAAFERLHADYPLKDAGFVSLLDTKLSAGISYLKNIHNETKSAALLAPDIRFDFDPNLDKNKMGTSSYKYAIGKSFTDIDNEMTKLARSGELSQTSFKIIAFADQRINPVEQHFTKALADYPVSCATCNAELLTAWGPKQISNLDDVDLKLSLIQGLTKYYGAGLIETEFLHLTSNSPIYPEQFVAKNMSGATVGTGTEYPNNQLLLIDSLNRKSIARNATSQIIPLPTATPPYRIANINTGITTYKTTNVFLLNMNYRIDNNGISHADTDGDGVSDDIEVSQGFDALNPRTNGYCLDSITIYPTLKKRCDDLATAGICNPNLDSDGDGLNECDELTLGTDPFDFDTDGDGIPDILEVINGNNALVDDNTTDSNSDGISDFMNLTIGLAPLQKPQFINPLSLIKVSLNFLNQSIVPDPVLGNVRIDNIDVTIQNFPLSKIVNVSTYREPNTYFVRSGSVGFNAATSLVNPQQSMIRPVIRPNTNNLVALLRIIDPDEPQKVYWEILNSEVSTNAASANLGKINISKFTQIKVIDRVKVQK